MNKIKKFLSDIFFPKFCLGCNREGNYLCKDCKAILDISQYRYCLCKEPKILSQEDKCLECQNNKLNGLYSAVDYQNPLIKLLIQKFRYEPFIKDLAKPLASVIIDHLQLLDDKPDFTDFILIPVPLSKRRFRWRGFNQATKIAKELSKNMDLALILDCLIRRRETIPQVELSKKEREENMKGIFYCKNQGVVSGRKILLVDDVFTTGATMIEAALVLKNTGAKEVWGITVARE
jgi:ComF family protein